MLVAKLPDYVVDVEFPAQAGVEFPDAFLNLGPQISERLNSFKQLTAKLLLRSFRQRRGLRHRQFKSFDHEIFISPKSRSRLGRGDDLYFS